MSRFWRFSACYRCFSNLNFHEDSYHEVLLVLACQLISHEKRARCDLWILTWFNAFSICNGLTQKKTKIVWLDIVHLDIFFYSGIVKQHSHWLNQFSFLQKLREKESRPHTSRKNGQFNLNWFILLSQALTSQAVFRRFAMGSVELHGRKYGDFPRYHLHRQRFSLSCDMNIINSQTSYLEFR